MKSIFTSTLWLALFWQFPTMFVSLTNIVTCLAALLRSRSRSHWPGDPIGFRRDVLAPNGGRWQRKHRTRKTRVKRSERFDDSWTKLKRGWMVAGRECTGRRSAASTGSGAQGCLRRNLRRGTARTARKREQAEGVRTVFATGSYKFVGQHNKSASEEGGCFEHVRRNTKDTGKVVEARNKL